MKLPGPRHFFGRRIGLGGSRENDSLMNFARLVPELIVSDISRSVEFYT